MAKTRGEFRAERLRKMEEMYVLKAYTDIELAERLNVERETVFKDRKKLMKKLGEDKWEEIEYGRWKIKRRSYISNVGLDLNESVPLYLFARKSARQLGMAHPYVVSAMRKLALCIRAPMTERLASAAERVWAQTVTDDKIRVFEHVSSAWVDKHKIDLDYVALHRNTPIRHTVSIYLIEPSVWSDAVYVVGYSEPDKKVMPFKLDRIVDTVLRRSDPIVPMPVGFDEHELLKHAWGIWAKTSQPVTVRLRFHGAVAVRRLHESRWHPLEDVSPPDAEGGVVWSAPIAEWQEMLPWVRGWGSAVAVLEPVEMRREIEREVRKMTQLYGLAMPSIDPLLARLLRCWGKTAAHGRFHPAIFHMIDVGHVAQHLLSESVSPRWRTILKRVLGWDDDVVRAWVPFWVAMHDIGKISVAFASLNAEQKARMQRENFDFGKWTESLFSPHGVVGQVVLADVLKANQIAILDVTRKTIEEVIGGHHGEFPKMVAVREFRKILQSGYEPKEWAELRIYATQKLHEMFVHDPNLVLPEIKDISGAVAALTGFTILCDWLGSDASHFVAQPDVFWEDYVLDSQQRAEDAVRDAGFMQEICSLAPISAEELFPNLKPPRPLQEAIDAIPELRLRRPCLAIIEAPTGEGKTEAAMLLAHRLAQSQKTDELYCALPTMATSNQMFGRMQYYLRDQLQLNTEVVLVHGQSFLVKDELQIAPLDNGDGKTQLEAVEWFSSKKRALLAPFGVGTIDQSELAVLNVRHNMLRLIGLAGKVVILDEVHAYDTYMSTIIERLLQWLAVLGCSVVLLSATLPLKRRLALASAYGAEAAEMGTGYPSVIIANKGEPIYFSSPAAWQANREMTIKGLDIPDNDLDEGAKDKAKWLMDIIKEGGCACWICNTVDRTQKLYAALADLNIDGSVDLMLLHARFPLAQRQKIEAELAALYGREGNRPMRGIVIGTQVLEQSLDLDFDVMVSDLPPIDLLLQRAGRLHRHARPRPLQHQPPVLYVNTPLQQNPDANLGADAHIYDEFILRQTWRVLSLPKEVVLPRDYRPLVEHVYGYTPTSDDALWAAWEKLDKKQIKEKQEADLRLLPKPDAAQSFVAEATRLTFEENESSAAWIVAQTRLGEESLNIIPIEVVDAAHGKTISDAPVVFELNKKVDHDIALKLLRSNMRISNHEAILGVRGVVMAQPCKAFAETTLLKGYTPLFLNDAQASFKTKNGEIKLYLHPILGLKISKGDQ